MKLSIDLHIHSALSPCGDNEMTPNNIVNMAYLKGLDVIAVTDHNTMLNAKPVMELGKEKNILVIPGIEVTTKEEVHVLCYFKELKSGMKFQDIIYDNLPNVKNNTEVFGKQLIFNKKDKVIGEVNKLLINSTNFSLSEIRDLAIKYGGVVVPAHIDKKAYSIISVLGFMPDNLKFNTVEISVNQDYSLLDKFIDIGNYNVIVNSDAHYLGDINERISFIDVKDKTIGSVISYLVKKRRNKV
ncbi:PHP domain-containing protein [Thermohalobacter berrensis]|uniref:Phosphoesterase n=1 Tax=Thermohalobacter berrensis TaxID=99594 RepID=A0A419T725_9FIRM|nr:PHP domain-containing protein [Thermohalobacter berrensis]RKD33188.1 phosphoesterase [Thermohalobacter berrensis]